MFLLTKKESDNPSQGSPIRPLIWQEEHRGPNNPYRYNWNGSEWSLKMCSFIQWCSRVNLQRKETAEQGWTGMIEKEVLRISAPFWVSVLIETGVKIMHRYKKMLQCRDGEQRLFHARTWRRWLRPLYFMLTDPMPESATESLPESLVWGMWAAFESVWSEFCSARVALVVFLAGSVFFELASWSVVTVGLRRELLISFSFRLSTSSSTGLWTGLVLLSAAQPVSCPGKSRTSIEAAFCSLPLLEKLKDLV